MPPFRFPSLRPLRTAAENQLRGIFTPLLPLVLLLLLCACSSTYHTPADMPDMSGLSPAETEVRDRLIDQYESWRGTPYRLGGLDKKGVDCSGLVHRIFLDLFNISLPRTTRGQKKYGNAVRPGEFLPGDLLFFKTGWFTHHVGIFIEDNLFLHASSSYGVRLSRLDKRYWHEAFRMAKRIDIF